MPPYNPSRTRREVLLNGRRVRVSDLIDAGLIEPGAELFYQQRLGEAPHSAIVTDKGRLRLPDGREFNTPSAAATSAAEVMAVAGWDAWRVRPDGPSLGQLRLELLKKAAEEVAAERVGPEAESVRLRMDSLEDMLRAAEAGEPRSMTVRELIGLWGFDERDADAILRVIGDLANHGLTTVPDFQAVGLDQTVRVVRPGAQRADFIDQPTEESEEKASEVDEESTAAIGLTLGNLLPKKRPLEYVSPTSSFDEAITVMELGDYSQLPVLANPHKLHGVVSWKTITKARSQNPDASFSDAIDKDVHVFDYDRRLVDVLPTLLEYEFIFVRDHERKITGIITAADVVRTYDETTTHFMLIGEIDRELRQLIRTAFDESTINDVCLAAGLTFETFGRMTISHYQAVLGNDACWKQLGWSLDRGRINRRLNEIRDLRNDVTHFNKESFERSEVEMLKNFLKTLRRYIKQ